MKSTLLAIAAGLMAQRSQKVTWLSLLAVILTYQVLGTMGEWALTGSLYLALQDFRMGLPGMALQLIGGYLVINVIRD